MYSINFKVACFDTKDLLKAREIPQKFQQDMYKKRQQRWQQIKQNCEDKQKRFFQNRKNNFKSIDKQISGLAIIISQENYIMRKGQEIQQDEDFQVLLSKQDYQELKRFKESYNRLKSEYQEKVKPLESKNHQLGQSLQFITCENEKLKKINNQVVNSIQEAYCRISKKLENLKGIHEPQTFLNKKAKNADSTISSNKHNDFESSIELISSAFDEAQMIFTSIISGQEEKVIELTSQNSLLQKTINQINEKSQLMQLQKMNVFRKYQFDLDEQRKDIQDQSRTIGQLEQQTSQLRKQNKQLIQKLQKSQTVRITQGKENQLLSQQNHQLKRQIKQLQEQIKQYQQHIQILKQSIKLQSRSKQPSKRRSHQQSQGGSKFEKEDFIKETLADYSRQIRKNLISIGNLSQDQIKQIGTSQLRTLVKFIQEMEEDFQ